MKTILFVCTGNTCRSSMAEVIFKDLLEKHRDELKDIRVLSAGISAVEGDAASSPAVQVMDEWGLNLKDHRARVLMPELVEEADLILTMTEKHRNDVIARFPAAAKKTFTLKGFALDPKAMKERDDLVNLILDKRKAYLEEHKEELAALKEKRRLLEGQIGEIDRKLREFETEINRLVEPEVKRLEEIKRQMESQDIQDPFGCSVEVYRACANEIKEALEKVIERLKE